MNVKSYVLAIIGFHLCLTITDFTDCSPVKISFNPEVEVSSAMKDLAIKISHAQWTKTPNDNVLLSPLAITIILNLLMLGSNGTTNLELKNALNYSSNLQEEVIHKTFNDLLLSLPHSENGIKISVNTKLFPREGSEILDSYKNIAKNSYFTEIQNVDFLGSPIVAMEMINSWVSNSTKGIIGKLLSGPLNSDTVYFPISVIFLDAAWENKFNTNSTKDGIFKTGRENITIPMMTSDMKIPYVKEDKGRFEIIALPYQGKLYSMYILKPIHNADKSKLVQIEDSLTSTYLKSLIDQMETQRVLVTVPRMRLSSDLDLRMDLKSLGVNQIFSRNSANFERFSDKQKLFVSDIFHKAVLDVTEYGTSGAAVTASVISPTSLPGRFIFDQPSILFVRNNENGLILFWGKVIKPQPLKL